MLIIQSTAPYPVFIEHPLLKKNALEQREFQVNIARECFGESTLVVLPTGLGKTVIALMVIAELLKEKGGKILFLAPTKPLVDQHAAFLSENLLVNNILVFTGEIKPEKRSELWKSSEIIVSTPQVIENDLNSGHGSIGEFSLIIFDEAHRAVGDYSYVAIAARYSSERDDPLVLGMTASPGYDLGKIAEVCKNLDITNIAVRSELDEDVAPYVYGIAIDRVRVDVPEEMDEITEMLQKILDEKVRALRKYHLIDSKRPPGIRDLLEAGNVLRAKLNSGKKNFHLFRALTIHAIAIKLNHAIDLAGTQGSDSLRNYLAKIIEDARTKGGSRASRELVKDARFEMARRMLDSVVAEHPKLDKVKAIVSDQLSQNPNSRIIVFTHYRDTCEKVTGLLEDPPVVRPIRFVGQATHGSDSGLKQKEQKQIIASFKQGKYNVLVATSVAEEGLDIPSTDLVVFYEPIPSEIRTIQRRGRTGRQRPGRVVVLLARETKDEVYHFSSGRKERMMHSQLESLRRKLKIAKKVSLDTGQAIDVDRFFKDSATERAAEKKARAISKSQALLSDFGAVASSGLKLIANSDRDDDVLKELRKIGIQFDERKSDPEDFVIGDEVAVLRETIDGFLTDIDRPNLQSKIADLQNRFKKPFVVVEGCSSHSKDIATRLPIYDVLNALIRRLRVPVVPTTDASDTAAFIASLVKVEMTRDMSRESDMRINLSEYQKRMIQGLPNVTSVLAERLLKQFGSVQKVLTATKEELMSVEGVGRVISEEILRVANQQYGSEKKS